MAQLTPQQKANISNVKMRYPDSRVFFLTLDAMSYFIIVNSQKDTEDVMDAEKAGWTIREAKS